ncbi:MAG: hypothetical protein IJ052_07715 [Oscillospiraceae bacterium]|jgi:hypothetical protein|nr:hypothetical protein [Oscillospiraceae bacterium]
MIGKNPQVVHQIAFTRGENPVKILFHSGFSPADNSLSDGAAFEKAKKQMPENRHLFYIGNQPM